MIKVAPGVQLRTHDLGESTGLVFVTCLVQVVAALEQIVQVRVPSETVTDPVATAPRPDTLTA